MLNQLCVTPALVARILCSGLADYFCGRDTEEALKGCRKIGGMTVAASMCCLLNAIAFFQIAIGLLKPTLA